MGGVAGVRRQGGETKADADRTRAARWNPKKPDRTRAALFLPSEVGDGRVADAQRGRACARAPRPQRCRGGGGLCGDLFFGRNGGGCVPHNATECEERDASRARPQPFLPTVCLGAAAAPAFRDAPQTTPGFRGTLGNNKKKVARWGHPPRGVKRLRNPHACTQSTRGTLPHLKRAARTGHVRRGETALPASGPLPVRVRFFAFDHAVRTRSASAAVAPEGEESHSEWG
eukprot:gene11734-biopygen19903